MQTTKLYQEKLNRVNTAFEGGTPDRIPVLSMADTYILALSHYSIEEAWTKSVLKNIDAYRTFDKLVYNDAMYDTGNTTCFSMLNRFGNCLYEITGECLQIKGSGSAYMKDDEYPQLIADPRGYLFDTMLPRKYELLRGTDEEIKQQCLPAAVDLAGMLLHNKLFIKGLEYSCGLPVLSNSATEVPPDLILDFCRDFVGISKDVRRHSDEIVAASKALLSTSVEIADTLGGPSSSKVCFIPLHLATYLRPKDFEKVFFSSMVEFIQVMNAKGYRLLFFCEGDWSAYADILKEKLPVGPNCYLFESGDLKLLRESIRGKGSFAGGMPLNTLKFGTRSECIDKAKQCMDDYAPGGGYIFTTNANLMNLNDVKLDNLIAVNEYVHTNGAY